MTVTYIDNVFSPEHLDILNNLIAQKMVSIVDDEQDKHYANDEGTGLSKDLGRLQIGNILTGEIAESLRERVIEIASSLSKIKLSLDHGNYSEYSNKYGSPNLPPHFDGDTNDLIINFQLSSNTSWDVGVGVDRYSLVDNSAVVFNGNTNIHWRPIKTFKDGEYVRMIFFRLYNSEVRSDYSNLPHHPDNDIFSEVRNIRNNLTN